jgi:hypothetical protein
VESVPLPQNSRPDEAHIEMIHIDHYERGHDMWKSFLQWWSQVDIVSWDALSAIGQAIGALGTLWAVLVALKQGKIAQKQTEIALQQVEEERKRAEKAEQEAKEALKPELQVRVNGDFEKYQILLVNTKPVPVFVQEMKQGIRFVTEDGLELPLLFGGYNGFKTEAPKRINFGDVCITEFTLETLCKYVKHYEETKDSFIKNDFFPNREKAPVFLDSFVLELTFPLATGEEYVTSIFLELETQIPEEPQNTRLRLYIINKKIDTIEEITKQDYFYRRPVVTDIMQKIDKEEKEREELDT